MIDPNLRACVFLDSVRQETSVQTRRVALQQMVQRADWDREPFSYIYNPFIVEALGGGLIATVVPVGWNGVVADFRRALHQQSPPITLQSELEAGNIRGLAVTVARQEELIELCVAGGTVQAWARAVRERMRDGQPVPECIFLPTAQAQAVVPPVPPTTK